ncbi:MAG: hypothetical protein JXO51_01730 [Candidatus Aminicenantes bacterium]|nr:hypothetical protein [Candidatus Aminicenantes bacterium]
MIVFRADVSPRSGLSHLQRCAYLAALLRKDARVSICSREDKRALKFLAAQKVPFAMIRDPGVTDIGEAKALIFDLSGFDERDGALLEKAKRSGMQTVQIVPAAGRLQPVDVLVAPFPPSGTEGASAAVLLAGPQASLLHHKFRHFNKVRRKYREKARLLFVHLGDALPYRDLRAIVDALHRLRFRMKIHPGLDLKKADKRNLMRAYPGIHFRGRSESPARAYFEADLALIPPGQEALEAAAVGTPALFMPLGKEDRDLAEACLQLGTGLPFPALEAMSLTSIREALDPLTPERRQQMGEAGKKLVDGLGVQRFFKVLKENGIIQ